MLLGAALWLAPPALTAQEPISCRFEELGLITCSIDIRSEFDSTLRQILESGFTNNLLYRLYLFRTDREEPLSLALVAFAQVFRLYTDVHYISREGVDGYVDRTDWEDAVAELSRFEIEFEAAMIDENPGDYFVAGILEINPLSEQHLAEARSWITQSRGGYRLFGMENQSFFGTFVSLFVNTDRRSAETVRYFRSANFEIIP